MDSICYLANVSVFFTVMLPVNEWLIKNECNNQSSNGNLIFYQKYQILTKKCLYIFVWFLNFNKGCCSAILMDFHSFTYAGQA